MAREQKTRLHESQMSVGVEKVVLRGKWRSRKTDPIQFVGRTTLRKINVYYRLSQIFNYLTKSKKFVLLRSIKTLIMMTVILTEGLALLDDRSSSLQVHHDSTNGRGVLVRWSPN